MLTSLPVGLLRSGNARRSSWVYGCRGWLKTVSTSAYSAVTPPYITRTESHISATTPKSWVTKRIANPNFSRRLARRLQNLGLNHDIQGCGWLIGNDDLGIASQGHSDHGPLAHTAGILVGVLGAPFRANTYQFQ